MLLRWYDFWHKRWILGFRFRNNRFPFAFVLTYYLHDNTLYKVKNLEQKQKKKCFYHPRLYDEYINNWAIRLPLEQRIDCDG